MRQVRGERNGWRDEEISRRHRKWGYDCPMVDIDFLVVEYHHSEPKALIEYKHEKAEITNTSETSYRALEKLATRAGIPFLVVQYSDNEDNYNIIKMYSTAKDYVKKTKNLTQEEYINLLRHIRGLEPESPIDLPSSFEETWNRILGGQPQ